MDSKPAAVYDGLTRALHWAAALLVVGAWALIEWKGNFPKGSEGRRAMTQLHYAAGLGVLLLLALRLPWRWLHPVAPLDAAAWTRRLAAATKLALYALMLAVPLGGIAAAQSRGDAIVLLGSALPDVFSALAPYRKPLKEVHETLGNALLVVAGVHAAAALWHHFALRDATLRRMLGRA